MPGHKKPVIGVKFLPVKYDRIEKEIDPNGEASANLESEKDYRYIYAVATLESVVLYDTQSNRPIAYLGNLHYAPLTDVGFSCDGSLLVMSSTDGFCSLVEFAEGELGISRFVPALESSVPESDLKPVEVKVQILNSSFIKSKLK